MCFRECVFNLLLVPYLNPLNFKFCSTHPGIFVPSEENIFVEDWLGGHYEVSFVTSPGIFHLKSLSGSQNAREQNGYVFGLLSCYFARM